MNHYIKPSLCIALLAASLAACQSTDREAATEQTQAPATTAAADNVLQITAIHRGDQHLFQLSADRIPAGWATFEFVNGSDADHFALLSRVPEGINKARYRDELGKVAQNFLDQVNEQPPSHPEAGFELAGWYSDVQVMGGPGITSPGHTSDMTANLTPGTYIIECFMKTPDGATFHHMLGMIEEITVTEARSEQREPTPTVDLTLRNSGVEGPSELSPGKHTVAVHFAEQQVYDNLGQNDVHLIRVDDDTDLAAVGAWINAMNPNGFASPPAPAEFLGGIQEMPAEATGYFTAELTPGRYAWISEVPDPAAKGMLKTFEVGYKP